MSKRDGSNDLPVPLEHLELPEAWNINKERAKFLYDISTGYNLRHGLYSNMPIMCKAKDCPYAQTCHVLPTGAAKRGERCIIEMAMIVNLLGRYCIELNIDPRDPGAICDVVTIKNIIDAEILISRCDRLLAMESMVNDEIHIVDKQGKAYYKPEVHKAIEIKEKAIERKQKNLRDLGLTRKDKLVMQQSGIKSPSEIISEIVRGHKGDLIVQESADRDDDI